MGYAPFSRLVNAPGEGGTVFTLEEDTGARFPAAPFTYLVWPVQTIPERGVNAEEGTVLTVTLDTLTVERPDDAVALTSGMAVQALSTQPLYSLREEIALTAVFPATDTGVTLDVRTPGGRVVSETLVEAADDGGSVYTRVLSADESGQWFYVFTSDQRVYPETDFFVRYSEVT